MKISIQFSLLVSLLLVPGVSTNGHGRDVAPYSVDEHANDEGEEQSSKPYFLIEAEDEGSIITLEPVSVGGDEHATKPFPSVVEEDLKHGHKRSVVPILLDDDRNEEPVTFDDKNMDGVLSTDSEPKKRFIDAISQLESSVESQITKNTGVAKPRQLRRVQNAPPQDHGTEQDGIHQQMQMEEHLFLQQSRFLQTSMTPAPTRWPFIAGPTVLPPAGGPTPPPVPTTPSPTRRSIGDVWPTPTSPPVPTPPTTPEPTRQGGFFTNE